MEGKIPDAFEHVLYQNALRNLAFRQVRETYKSAWEGSHSLERELRDINLIDDLLDSLIESFSEENKYQNKLKNMAVLQLVQNFQRIGSMQYDKNSESRLFDQTYELERALEADMQDYVTKANYQSCKINGTELQKIKEVPQVQVSDFGGGAGSGGPAGI